MTDPLITAIATAAVGKVAETLSVQAQRAIEAIIKQLRERFHGKPAEIAVLDQATAETDPDDSFPVEALARALEREFAADPAFRDEIQALWEPVARDSTVAKAANSFTGVARTVTQIGGDVHGDLTVK